MTARRSREGRYSGGGRRTEYTGRRNRDYEGTEYVRNRFADRQRNRFSKRAGQGNTGRPVRGYSDSEGRKRAETARKSRQNKVKKQRILIISLAVLAVLIAAFLIIEVFPVYPSAKMEVGTEASAGDFVKFSFLKASFAKDSEKYDKNKPGTYKVRIKAGLFTHTCELTIVDTTPPVLVTQDIIVGREGSYGPKDFVVSGEDISEVTLDFAKAPDPGVIGTAQEVMIRATDAAGNATEEPAHLTILPTTYRLTLESGSPPPDISAFIPEGTDNGDSYFVSDVNAIDYNTIGETDIEIVYNGTHYPAKICILDTISPVFTMAENFTAYLGESIRYKDHVMAVDNSGACDIQVDTSRVDPNTEGTYPVTYTARDINGNSASVTIQITIARKTADEEFLFGMVDGILAQIISEGMSQRDKVEAIYNYVNGTYPFVNWSDKSSYVIAATDMIRNGQGDCYSFFALTKALLTRAGVPNLDIASSGWDEHYWNLVDIGDGHGWYHVDTTPNIDPCRVCLWTTADLQTVNDGRYFFNAAAYPPIP